MFCNGFENKTHYKTTGYGENTVTSLKKLSLCILLIHMEIKNVN